MPKNGKFSARQTSMKQSLKPGQCYGEGSAVAAYFHSLIIAAERSVVLAYIYIF